MKRLTKRNLAEAMRQAGRTEEEISRILKIPNPEPSVDTNAYARMFTGVLRFKTLEAAQESVARIDALYHQFEDERDRRGMHQAQLMALIGKNRAESTVGMHIAEVFRAWLVEHL